jgi:hypothetical protein
MTSVLHCYIYNYKCDHSFGSITERCWVLSKSVKLHDSGKGDDNCPEIMLDEMDDHGHGGKKDVRIRDKAEIR